MLILPWHLADCRAGGLNVTLPPAAMTVDGVPGQTGEPWADSVIQF